MFSARGGFRFVSAAGPVSLNAVRLPVTEYYENEDLGAVADSTQITASVWLKATATTPRTNAFGFYVYNSSGGARFVTTAWLYNGGATTARVAMQTGSGTIDRTSTETGLYGINEWVHMAACWDSVVANSLQLWCNGVKMTITGHDAYSGQPNIWTDVYQNPKLWVNGFNNGGTGSSTCEVAQIWVDSVYYNLDNNIQYFYDDGPVDLGSTGTGTGLAQPLVYHNGNTSTFPTNNGSMSYTLSAVGGNITDATGPSGA